MPQDRSDLFDDSSVEDDSQEVAQPDVFKPPGWKYTESVRARGVCRGRKDRLWVTVTGRKIQSLVRAQKFFKLTHSVNGDEARAWKLLSAWSRRKRT